MYQDFTTTPIFRRAALRFPASGTQAQNEIPLVLDDYKPPTRTPQTNVVTSIPHIESANTVYGGTFRSTGSSALNKITMSGYIETPTQKTGDTTPYATPLLKVDNKAYTYADLIAMYIEGRLAGNRTKVNPLWFRDPFGRVFTNPTIFDFTANYVEAVPGRTTFTMVLKV